MQKELDLAFAAAGSARAANGGSHADDDDDNGDDDEYEDDEGLFGSEQLFDTPLDKLDSYVIFGQVIQGESIAVPSNFSRFCRYPALLKHLLPPILGLQQSHAPLLQQATASLGPSEQQVLHDVMAKALSGGESVANAPQQA